MSDFRQLPSVHAVLEALSAESSRLPHALVVAEIRRTLDQARESIRAGAPAPDVAAEVRLSLRTLEQPSLRRVINATGVILHTNLGRAPLPAAVPTQGYSNLEYDLNTGRRGKRDTHIGPLLERLLRRPRNRRQQQRRGGLPGAERARGGR